MKYKVMFDYKKDSASFHNNVLMQVKLENGEEYMTS